MQVLTDAVLILQKSSAEINTKLDKLLLMIKSHDSRRDDITEVFASASISTDGNFDTFCFPLNSIEECQKLNQALAIPKFSNDIMKNIFKNIGKNDGEVDGHFLNKIGNQIFTDVLLSKYTYKGISRNGIHKENFSELKNVMSFLQNVLFTVSPIFDQKRTEKYVQTKLLRHSGSRVKRW